MSTRSEEVGCPECGAANPINSKFCESCGLVLTAQVRSSASSPSSGTRPTRRRKKPAKDEGREIERSLSHARDTLKTLRLLFGIFGAISVLPTVILLMASTRAGEFLLPALIALVFTLFLFAGVFFVFVQPLFFTITAACMATLLAVLTGISGNWIWFGLFTLIALGSWCSLPIVLNIVRLQKDYPHLITSAKLKARESRDVGTSAARVRAAERTTQRRQQAMKTYGIVGGILVLGVGAIVAVNMWPDNEPAYGSQGNGIAALSPEETQRIAALFDPAVERFHSAWRASDHDTIAQLGSMEFHARWWAKVQRGLDKRGWSQEFPRIDLNERFDGASPTEREVWFAIDPKGTLKTHWVFERGKWAIQKIVFSRTK